jgi:hypothetical protein
LIFSLAHAFGSCGRCRAPTFLWVSSKYPDGAGSWCPTCKQHWVCAGATRSPVTEQAHDLLPGNVKSTLAYAGHLYPDGLVSWVAEASVAGAEALDRMEASLRWLMRGARRRQQILRGYDRWVFRREADVYWCRHEDQELPLEPMKAGARKPGRRWRCDACSRTIETGARCYRAAPSKSVWGWSRVRLCAACVEVAPIAIGRGALRVIEGG